MRPIWNRLETLAQSNRAGHHQEAGAPSNGGTVPWHKHDLRHVPWLPEPKLMTSSEECTTMPVERPEEDRDDTNWIRHF